MYLQVATALGELESIGVIHANIHPENILVAGVQIKPLRVKIIDFGLALHRSEAKPGMALQIQTSFR